MTDTSELLFLIGWLEGRFGTNLVSDDCGHWAVTGSGSQPVPDNGYKFENPVSIHSIIEPEQWHPTILEALRHFYKEANEED